jgi:hypothetical protein
VSLPWIVLARREERSVMDRERAAILTDSAATPPFSAVNAITWGYVCLRQQSAANRANTASAVNNSASHMVSATLRGPSPPPSLPPPFSLFRLSFDSACDMTCILHG